MRDMLFLSHANPEDNAITQWLALQLAREGYPVWCDLTKLLGGEDFWENIEGAIRGRTIKFLYVLSRVSNHKPGALKELAVAAKVQKKEKIKDFIIPLWLDNLPADDFNIELGRLNAIRFQEGWARGLAQLLKKLEEDGIAKKPSFGPTAVRSWWREHVSAAGGLRDEPEPLVSNWYPVEPTALYFHELTRSGLGALEIPTELPWPGVRHNQYLISFAPASAFDGRLGSEIRVKSTLMRTVGGPDPDPAPRLWTFAEERGALAHLLRQVWLGMLSRRSLPQYALANNVVAFYFTKDQLPDDRAWFIKADGSRTYRAVVGYKTISHSDPQAVRYWHFAMQAKPTTFPVLAFTMKPHVIFSDDGTIIWDKKEPMHRARRSQCKDWWNDRWRDLIAGAVSWLAGSDGALLLPVGPGEALRVSRQPVGLESPVSYEEPSRSLKGEEIPGDENADGDERENEEDLEPDYEAT